MLDHTVRKDLETTPRKHTDLYLEQPLVATCDDDKKEKERSATKTNQTKLAFFFSSSSNMSLSSKVSLLSPFEVQTSLCTFLVDRFNNDL